MNIEAKELSKIYGSGESRVVALDKVNLEIASVMEAVSCSTWSFGIFMI